MLAPSFDRELITAIQDGFPVCSRPYARIAQQLDVDESAVVRRISELLEDGTIKRLGVVVKHRALGYRANAMVVWDIADDEVEEIGGRMATAEGVTLCYRRPRRLPTWPYNLFCMIHGRDETVVRGQVAQIATALGLQEVPHSLLFSKRCFKQRGARYMPVKKWANTLEAVSDVPE